MLPGTDHEDGPLWTGWGWAERWFGGAVRAHDSAPVVAVCLGSSLMRLGLAACQSVSLAFEGSNPSPATTSEIGP